MEQFSQNLPPTNLTQAKPTSSQTIGAAVPTISAPTAVGGGGSQPTNQPAAVNEAAGDNTTSLPPDNTRKRKANASGPRRTSTAWDHFIKLPENEANDPTTACKYCGKKYLCDTKTHGTSNMLAHLKTCPKYTYAINQDPNQTVLTFAPGRSGEGISMAAASHRFNLEACRKALAMFIILDEQPFRVVEGQGFKHLSKQLQPQFIVPSRHTVARDCFKLYSEEKVRLKALLGAECSRVALSTDCWTSIQNLNYLTLTAHFIDKEWNYQKRIISFSIVPNHRGETIGRHVEEVLRGWGLRNVSIITVDNASSNDVAVAYLKNRIKNMNGLVGGGDFLHMRCCAHILNLVVNDGLKDLSDSISSIRNAVRFVRSSPQRMAKFKECIEFARITSQKLVCLDVPTRWNSTYMMLDAAEKFEYAFEKLEFEDSAYLDVFGTAGPPNKVDWENARAFVKFLKIFYEATKVFSSSWHVNIHSAFHQLASIHSELRQATMSSNSVFNNMGWEMKRKYDKYWGNILNINQLLYFGVILDPRYKLRYIAWSFQDMYKDDPNFFNQLMTSLNNNLSKMYGWYVTAHEQQNMSRETSQGSMEGSSSVGSFGPAEVSPHLARTDAFKNYLREKNSIDQKNELERYLAEVCVDGDDKFDLLVWWKHNSSRFPILSSMARDVLATPVSTVASESAFSTGGRVLDTFRSSLNPEMAEALICTQNWLKPSLYQFKDINLNEDFETSEKIVTEFHQRSSNFGRVGRTTIGAGTGTGAGLCPSSQSQPAGCD